MSFYKWVEVPGFDYFDIVSQNIKNKKLVDENRFWNISKRYLSNKACANNYSTMAIILWANSI